MGINSQDLPEQDRFSRLLTERKHFIDTVKLIAYRAETTMASVFRETLSRADDARSLLRQFYNTEIDLIPDLDAKTLTVRLHHLTHAAHDEAVRHLCDQLNATETVFPDTELRLVYQLGHRKFLEIRSSENEVSANDNRRDSTGRRSPSSIRTTRRLKNSANHPWQQAVVC